MYEDAIYRWNVFIGCKFDCIYCKKSFKAQMKRQKPVIDKNGKKRGCQKCYDYEPHFHEERLNINFDKKSLQTKGDEFIWVGSSGDISFCKFFDFQKILNKIKEYPNRTFFFQTKNPIWFRKWEFPENVLLGMTLESNIHYPKISRALDPWRRTSQFLWVKHPRKSITIEPILEFDFHNLYIWIKSIKPERVYIGYDSKKNNLPEPPLEKVLKFIKELRMSRIKVKEKLMREAWDQ